MTRWSTRLGKKHRRRTAVSAARYVFGTAVIVAVLVGGARPALAGTSVTATCDGWSVVLDGYDADSKTVSIWVDDVLVVDGYYFTNGFNVGGDWQNYADFHEVLVSVYINPGFHGSSDDVRGCPTSAPTTTPPTTAPAPTTTTSTTKAPAPATTVAETPEPPETTTTASTSSTTSTPTTTTLAPITTLDVDATETEASDMTVVAAADTESPSGSDMATLLIGLLVGIALTIVVGGAWYLGRRSTQN